MNASGIGPAEFRTTHWSVVLQAGVGDAPRAADALERLCRAYWRPIYGYVRRRGYGPHEAEDMVQGFFEGLLRREGLRQVDPAKGRFRSFLLASVNHFLANEWDRSQRLKRGGGCEFVSIDAEEIEGEGLGELADEATPERDFERQWARTVLARVVDRLREDYTASGFGARFEGLREFLLGDPEGASYADAGRRLGMSVAAVTSAIHRLRVRYREVFRDEIAQTVADPDEVDEEIRHLARALAG
ncbi:MAG: sigma-70 family RNA polymerase sigma factor [Verrucomicrobiae bacterium]|nr:sigma-70 family RNA polymerase sigma factor [Verrucomicrobiae bacterium]